MDKIGVRDLTSLARKKVIPISVLIEVCHSCNVNCIHCCLSDHTKIGMVLEQYEQLFDQLVEAGTFFVILTGGEPFVRPDFIKIVTAARKRRLSVTIFTNGTLLTRETIMELKSLYVQEIHISIYSSDERIHDSITQSRGSFKKSIWAIKELVKSGITVRIKCPLTNISAQDINGIKNLASELGVDIQFTTVITAKDDGDKTVYSLRLTRDQLRLALLDPEISEHVNEPTRFQENTNYIPCDTVLNGGSVDPYGNVYVCNQWQIKGGNVLQSSFGEIWKNSSIFQRMRAERLSDLNECKNCNLFQFCTRCPGLALLEDGDSCGCSSAARLVAKKRKQLMLYPKQSHIFSKI